MNLLCGWLAWWASERGKWWFWLDQFASDLHPTHGAPHVVERHLVVAVSDELLVDLSGLPCSLRRSGVNDSKDLRPQRTDCQQTTRWVRKPLGRWPPALHDHLEDAFNKLTLMRNQLFMLAELIQFVQELCWVAPQ